jgi:tetratricopeptide (TPR) repeat protein
VSGARAIQLVEAGLWLRMSGDLEGARRLFEQALRLDPGCDRARELLGTEPAAVEALPEELQHVPSSNTNLFAVPLPRLFPETVVEVPEAPTDPFIPLSMVAQLTPAYGTQPLPPARTPAPPPAPFRGTPLPPPPPRGPSAQGTPLPAPGPRGTQGTPLPAAPPSGPSARGTPLPGPAPRGPSAQGTPLPGPAPRGPSGRGTPLPASPPRVAPGRGTPLPAAPPSAPSAASSPSGWTLPASLPSSSHSGPAPVPLPEPAQRSAPLASSEQPSTVASDDWWTDGVTTPAPPKDAWEVGRPQPTTLPPSEATETDALNMVAPLPANAGGTPLPAQMPSDPLHEARMLLQRAAELQELDDHSGARELLLEAQALDPDAPDIARALGESEQTLQALYESKLGKLSVVPRVRLRDDEVIWLNLDHRAGFILAQIDGSLSFDDLFSVSGMSRLDTARILVQLLEQRVIIR